MDRKQFLKNMCGLGACGCVLGLLGEPEGLQAAPAAADAADQRLAFARYQVAKMTGFMATGTAAPACAAILQSTNARLARARTTAGGGPSLA